MGGGGGEGAASMMTLGVGRRGRGGCSMRTPSFRVRGGRALDAAGWGEVRVGNRCPGGPPGACACGHACVRTNGHVCVRTRGRARVLTGMCSYDDGHACVLMDVRADKRACVRADKHACGRPPRPRRWSLKPHSYVAATAERNRIFLMTVKSTPRQWKKHAKDVEAIWKSFDVSVDG